MRNSVKLVLLGVILVFPIVIYLFLQAFGENKYELSVFPEEPVEISGCGKFDSAYRVDSLGCELPDGSKKTITLTDANYLLHFPSSDKGIQNNEGNELRRFLQKTASHSFRLITFAAEADSTFWNRTAASGTPGNWLVFTKCADRLEEIKKCRLLLPLADIKRSVSESRMVLVDSKGRIRGFYVPSDKEDIDRLIIEIEILETSGRHEE